MLRVLGTGNITMLLARALSQNVTNNTPAFSGHKVQGEGLVQNYCNYLILYKKLQLVCTKPPKGTFHQLTLQLLVLDLPGCFGRFWWGKPKGINMEHFILVPALRQHKTVLRKQACVEFLTQRVKDNGLLNIRLTDE